MGDRANFMRIGKWSQCYHCFNLFAGEHYCGAPWQLPPLGAFPDGVDQRWVDAVREKRMVSSAGTLPERAGE